MKTNLLFPHRYRLIGWLIFIPSALLGLATMYLDYAVKWLSVGPMTTISLFQSSPNNLTNELAGVGVIIGLMLIAFSREEIEDEMTNQLRLEALQWSVYLNYLILLLAILLVYDGDFFSVMVYNMFTMLLVFIARFRWLIYRTNKLLAA
ncbi:MAG: hypothetical protein H7319_07090 [Spirosoma sp.]|nr:hypothetical protein [Spirosoma sp.]